VHICDRGTGQWQGHPVRQDGGPLRLRAHLQRGLAARGGGVGLAARPQAGRDDGEGRFGAGQRCAGDGEGGDGGERGAGQGLPHRRLPENARAVS